MPAQLKIRWDGNVPGVAEHRLSLAAFGESLHLLLRSLRRIATQMVSTAVQHEPPTTGRYATIARLLDIEITSIVGDSTGFDSVVSFAQPPDELPLFADLPDRATTELLEAIEQESKAMPRNWMVRQYLFSLPEGIHRQTYELHDNGVVKKRVEIADIRQADVPPELPSLLELEGNIVGVGFEPGRTEVRIKPTSGTTASLDANNDQVEIALNMRKSVIRVLGIHDGKRGHLLRINRASDPKFKVTSEAIEEHIFKRWSGVFARLAKG